MRHLIEIVVASAAIIAIVCAFTVQSMLTTYLLDEFGFLRGLGLACGLMVPCAPVYGFLTWVFIVAFKRMAVSKVSEKEQS